MSPAYPPRPWSQTSSGRFSPGARPAGIAACSRRAWPTKRLLPTKDTTRAPDESWSAASTMPTVSDAATTSATPTFHTRFTHRIVATQAELGQRRSITRCPGPRSTSVASPGEARRWGAAGQNATVKWLVNGSGSSALVGPAPTVNGAPIDPINEWGHDQLWWLDRMIRTPRPLVEKMTLFWHDHFATRDQETPLMLRQNRMLRKYALGDFDRLLRGVTTDPAMQLFLSLADSSKWAPNENYARELMELFTLGHGYSEHDIRQAARGLTGWRAKWGDTGFHGIFYDRTWHDQGYKRLYGKRRRYDWRGVLHAVTSHRNHGPFIVGKLWSYFITAPLDAHTKKSLVATYRKSGHKIKPVVEKILRHPALYADLDHPDMIKSPVVFLVGALRSIGAGIQRESWTWLLPEMGQELFSP